jgi:hypothetical protein
MMYCARRTRGPLELAFFSNFLNKFTVACQFFYENAMDTHTNTHVQILCQQFLYDDGDDNNNINVNVGTVRSGLNPILHINLVEICAFGKHVSKCFMEVCNCIPYLYSARRFEVK